ncbi:MAG TPA: TM2 domain-containing protein [Flavobacteriales bacterium]|nr:TM2 domain-containing protein [Flavobacteriales bacterium]HRN35871.1 TM2 domain-containing protein [Flavobacteriales bacterium]HRO40005.1 TM2 domain-containing protein [Flavobacteriales bacterium]HRP80944.1 TM2 domain-containing protein [Flavobacteriales bacterium]HRQ84682.1 TM2 domain-containing protein [Flavobacteriales bacterium]
MEQKDLLMMIPGLKPEELMMLQNSMSGLNETQTRQFLTMYSTNRKDGQTMLLLALIGLLGVAGIQRFIIGQTGMGVVYLLTVGFCGIGTIIDAVNANKLAMEHNQAEAMRVLNMMKMMGS